MIGDWRRGTDLALSVCLVGATLLGVAQDVKTGRTDSEETHDYYTPELPEITWEERARAICALKRVVPSSWIAKSTSAVSKFAEGGGFGYMWWVENDRQIPAAYRGAFSARGQEGQYLTVIPALDMVVAHLPKSGKRPMTRDDYEKILMTVFLAKNDPLLTESVLKHLSDRQRLRASMAKTQPNE